MNSDDLADGAAGAAAHRFLVASIGGVSYAVPLRQVDEISPPMAVTRVPRAPAGVAGVMNHRGDLLPVVDLAEILGHAAGHGATASPDRRLLIVAALGGRVAVLSDRAPDLVAIDPAERQSLRGAQPPGVTHLVARPGGLLSVLDIEASIASLIV